MKKPTQEQVLALRKKHGLTQRQCADMLSMTTTGFRYYEYSLRTMHGSTWELFQIKCAALAD